jgi:hypothetical protein
LHIISEGTINMDSRLSVVEIIHQFIRNKENLLNVPDKGRKTPLELARLNQGIEPIHVLFRYEFREVSLSIGFLDPLHYD